MHISTIGAGLAKTIFLVHGIGSQGEVIVDKPLRRGQMMAFFTKLPACLIGMEACSTAHHRPRSSIEIGHTVRLLPPANVEPYVRRAWNDAADARCELQPRRSPL